MNRKWDFDRQTDRETTVSAGCNLNRKWDFGRQTDRETTVSAGCNLNRKWDFDRQTDRETKRLAVTWTEDGASSDRAIESEMD